MKYYIILAGVMDIICMHFDIALTFAIFIATILEGESTVGKKNIWYMVIWLIVSIIMVLLVSIPRLLQFCVFAKKGFPMS